MKSKDDVINEFLPDHSYSLRDGLAIVSKFDCYNKNKVKRMMDEYAKELAIDFAKFSREYRQEEHKKYVRECQRLGGPMMLADTREEYIFDQYLKSKKAITVAEALAAGYTECADDDVDANIIYKISELKGEDWKIKKRIAIARPSNTKEKAVWTITDIYLKP